VTLSRGQQQAEGYVMRETMVANDESDALLPHAVARQLLLGRRESLTIAGELGVPVAAINEALLHLRDLCNRCITLLQPYSGEPRFIVMVDDWEPLKRLGWRRD
jgi:hypothetical protein